MATSQINVLFSLLLIWFSVTAALWDGRSLNQNIHHQTIIPPCSTGGLFCDEFTAVFAGEVIVAFGCVMAALVGLLSVLKARSGHTAPTVQNSKVLELVGKVFSWAIFALIFALTIVWGVSNFNVGTSTSPLMTEAMKPVYVNFLSCTTLTILSLAVLVYYRYSTQNFAVFAASLFTALGIAWLWGLSQFSTIRSFGSNFDGAASVHLRYCDPTEDGVMMTGDNPVDDTLCYGANILAVCSSLYGIAIGLVAFYFLAMVPFRMSDNPMLGCCGGNREKMSLPQIVVFLFDWVGLIGLLILAGASIQFAIKTNNATDAILFSIPAQIFAIFAVLSLMCNHFVAFSSDANSIDRTVACGFVLNIIVITIGFALLPAAAASQDANTYTTGAALCTADDKTCQARKAGAGGIFLITLGSVFQFLFMLIVWRQNKAKVGETGKFVGMSASASTTGAAGEPAYTA